MNRFKIVLGKENEFEEVWRTRETYLDEVEGFKEFHLLKVKVMTSTLYTRLTQYGIVKMILLHGQNQNHLRKHIRMLVKINLCI